jgi:hypothetical protein
MHHDSTKHVAHKGHDDTMDTMGNERFRNRSGSS